MSKVFSKEALADGSEDENNKGPFPLCLPSFGASEDEANHATKDRDQSKRTYQKDALVMIEKEGSEPESELDITVEDILPHFPGPGCVTVTDEVSDDEVFQETRTFEAKDRSSKKGERRKSWSYKVVKSRAGSLEIIRVDPLVSTEAEVKEAFIQRNLSKKDSRNSKETGE